LALVLAFGLVAPGFSAPAPPARTVLVLGDSLSAGYGLARGQGWVDLTSERLARERPAWKTVNASISGETSAGGAARVAAELARHRPAVVVIELGANDGLRGLPTAQMRANLERIVQRAQASGARVLLVGMQMPPNLGRRYTRDFEAVFSETAKKYRTGFLPFLLAPIAADRAAFQNDNLHPVATAQPKLRDHVWTQLRPLLSAPQPAPAARASGG
jgi:acyl-CoA thioesterase-1